jgi:hypothetical protein
MKKNIKITIIITLILILTLPFQLLGIFTLNSGVNGQSRGSHLVINLSTVITEESDEFLLGTMDNLTIDGNGNLILENDFIPSWTKMDPISAPFTRWLHSMVYDSANERTILFGGWPGADDDETWVYNLTDNTWTNKNPTTKPSARSLHSMAYDSVHERTILFGGWNVGGYNDETWVYNLTDNSWTNMTITGNKPSARRYHSMTYDSTHDRTILFGGDDAGGDDDETWVYNLTDNTWTNMTPATSPSARSMHSMIYDSAYDRVVLFGGDDAVGYNNETWVYNLTDNTWTNMTTTGDKPSKRSGHSMAYDSAHDRTILFGGTAGGDETWVYNLADNTWTNMTTTGDKPSGRAYHSIVYDSAHDRTILFGGTTGGDETWIYSNYIFHQQGIFNSKVNSLDSLSKIDGRLKWTPINQSAGTSLEVQVGFSSTSTGGDFFYLELHDTDFEFKGIGKYMIYRVTFKSDSFQTASPLLNKLTISYSLEIIPSDSWIIPGIIGAVISCAATLSIIGIVLYSKKKAVRPSE